MMDDPNFKKIKIREYINLRYCIYAIGAISSGGIQLRLNPTISDFHEGWISNTYALQEQIRIKCIENI